MEKKASMEKNLQVSKYSALACSFHMLDDLPFESSWGSKIECRGKEIKSMILRSAQLQLKCVRICVCSDDGNGRGLRVRVCEGGMAVERIHWLHAIYF